MNASSQGITNNACNHAVLSSSRSLDACFLMLSIRLNNDKLSFYLQDDGFVAKILVEAGTKDIKVGTPLAILVGMFPP